MDPNLTGRGEENLGMGFPDRPSIGTFSPAKTRDFLTGGDKNPGFSSGGGVGIKVSKSKEDGWTFRRLISKSNLHS
jgi:hypothetical protein